MKRNSWIFAFLLVCSLLAGSIFLRGYVVITLVSLAQLCWDSNDYPIVIQSWEGNTDAPNVVAGSNIKRAILEAMNRWARVSTLSLNLGPDTATNELNLGDGVHVVTLADTVTNRNAVGGSAGVSFFRFIGSEIVATDVIFNPDNTWSTMETGTFGISSFFHVALHECLVTAGA